MCVFVFFDLYLDRNPILVVLERKWEAEERVELSVYRLAMLVMGWGRETGCCV